MSTPRIKFCGLTRPEDIETSLALGVDFLGFIVECKSPRRLSVADASRLSLPAKGAASRVAVTVNAKKELIASIATSMQPEFIQLHGEESPARLHEIKTNHDVGLIKALSISDAYDLDRASTYFEAADMLLLDAKPPKGESQRGGHGHSFDWKILKGFKSPIPLIIAGGLSPDTIGKARTRTNANIFDVSSGIEAAPGIKDAILMTKFMKAAKHE